MASYEALYDRKCKSPLYSTEVREARVHDLDLVQYTSKMVSLIKECLKIAFSRQKSYADPRRKDVEFIVSDYAFLKVSPMKGVMRFGKKGKLTPHYIGPFEVTDRMGTVAYQLELLPNLSHVHPAQEGHYNVVVLWAQGLWIKKCCLSCFADWVTRASFLFLLSCYSNLRLICE
ncbi:uncharacterized protein LOC131169400 [Hevea brasiliensis]|uniref:uncharacterized protein LOC131169400 n=1 Tax=Hevea brasiliensis TaxID=3981 RepID=UPI0025F96048|nr:uncharacterized protein LOC131169400 [Hevea brasiliensis]